VPYIDHDCAVKMALLVEKLVEVLSSVLRTTRACSYGQL